MRKPLAIIILMYLFIMPCFLAMGETDVYQIEDGKDDVIMTETLALDTDGPYIILKDYDVSYKIGLRFTNINISRGETITEAILSVYCKYDFPNGTGTVTIYGLKVADAPVLDEPEDLNGPLTENYVIWNISDVKGPDKWHNVTITPIIQEIVNQYGWESGNSLALIILSEKGNIRRQFTSADYMNPAKLYITITPPTPPEENYELITTYKGYVIYNVTEYEEGGGWTLFDFTEFTEVDPNNKIDILNSTYIYVDNLGSTSGDHNARVYKTYSSGYWDDFVLNFTYYWIAKNNYGFYYYVITLDNGDPNGEIDELKPLLGVYFSVQSSTKEIYIKEIDSSGNTHYSPPPGIEVLSYNRYYLFILNKTNNFVNLKVYDMGSSGNLKNLLGELNYTLHDADPKYSRVDICWIHWSPNYGMTGYHINYQYGGSLTQSGWHIEIFDENGTKINDNFTSLDDAISYIDNVLIGPEEEPYNPEVGGYEVIPRRIVKLSFLMSGLGLMMVGLIAISYKPTLGRAIMGILMIVLAMGLLIHLTQI